MLSFLTDPTVLLSLATLAALEIVLGIDNLLFVQIVAERVSPEKRDLARRLGLSIALIMRLILLAGISWIVALTAPIFTVFDFTVSWRDIILISGGLFLLAKGTMEIHHTVEGEGEGPSAPVYLSFGAAIAQIVMLDLVFSLDSVITAVGMAEHLSIMVTAVILAMIVMIVASVPVGRFVQRHPTVKMLCLAFLLLVGVALVAEGLHFHIPKGYLYFAIAFSALVEGLNLWARRNRPKKAATNFDGTTFRSTPEPLPEKRLG